MTDDLARAEEQLRAVLTTRAADIPAKNLHDGVVRRHRPFSRMNTAIGDESLSSSTKRIADLGMSIRGVGA